MWISFCLGFIFNLEKEVGLHPWLGLHSEITWEAFTTCAVRVSPRPFILEGWGGYSIF